MAVVAVAAVALWMGCAKDSSDLIAPGKSNAPVARFIVAPEVGNPNSTEIFVDASDSTDPTDSTSALEVRWDWEDDGVWDTGYLLEKSAIHVYDELGVKNIRLMVRNTIGSTGTAAQTVRIISRPAPVADFVVEPEEGTVDTQFRFDASPSRDSLDPPDALMTRWDVDGDGSWDTEYGTSKTMTFRYGFPGRWDAFVEVMNTSGLTNQTSFTVHVRGSGAVRGSENGSR